jgi:hypothetical protein
MLNGQRRVSDQPDAGPRHLNERVREPAQTCRFQSLPESRDFAVKASHARESCRKSQDSARRRSASRVPFSAHAPAFPLIGMTARIAA